VIGIGLGLAFVGGIAFGWYGVAIATLIGCVLWGARRLFGGVVVFLAVASLLGVVRAVPPPLRESPEWVGTASAIQGSVVSGPMSTASGQKFNLRAREILVDGHWQDVDDELCVYAPSFPDVHRGDVLFVADPPQSLMDVPPRVADVAVARECVGIVYASTFEVMQTGRGVLHAADVRRHAMVRRLQAIAPGDTGSLMAGLVTGDDGALSEEAYDAFLVTGTTHITAVSGSNFALFVVAIVALGGQFGLQRRVVWLWAVVLVIWSYALLVGLAPPAFRAAVLATGVVFAVVVGRRPDIVTLTVLAAAVQLAIRPSDYWTLSFRLSFVSALALALVLRGRDAEGIRGWFRFALLATIAAQIATTPLLLAAFGRVSPLALPANLLIGPLVTIAFPLSLLSSALGAVWAPLGDAVGMPAAFCSSLALDVVRLMAGLPGARLMSGQPGWVEITVISIICALLIVAMSEDGRRVSIAAGRWARAEPQTACAIGSIVGFGWLFGMLIGSTR